jgi:hypothetical protein
MFPSMHLALPRARVFVAVAVFALAVPLLVAACGDDASDGGGSPTATPGRPESDTATSDAAYMKAVCTAANDATGPVLTKLAGDTSILNDQQKLVETLTPALTALSQKLADIQPPADLKDYHEKAVSELNVIVGKAKSGQVQDFGDLAGVEDTLKPPADVQERVMTAANSVPECQQSLFFASGFFGSAG